MYFSRHAERTLRGIMEEIKDEGIVCCVPDILKKEHFLFQEA